MLINFPSLRYVHLNQISLSSPNSSFSIPVLHKLNQEIQNTYKQLINIASTKARKEITDRINMEPAKTSTDHKCHV